VLVEAAVELLLMVELLEPLLMVAERAEKQEMERLEL
jgi:hypothetical protein